MPYKRYGSLLVELGKLQNHEVSVNFKLTNAEVCQRRLHESDYDLVYWLLKEFLFRSIRDRDDGRML